MHPVVIFGNYDDGSLDDKGARKGLNVPVAIDSSGNVILSATVTLNTALGTLSTAVGTLNGHIVTLDSDVNLLTTAVNAMTATQTSAAPVSRTVTCPATAGTAIILGTQACNQIMVASPSTNTINVVVGTSTTNLPFTMAPGDHYVFPVANANLLYCKSTTANAAQVLNWMAL